MFYRPQLFEGRLALNTGLASVSSNSKHLRRSIPFTAAHAYIAHIWQDLPARDDITLITSLQNLFIIIHSLNRGFAVRNPYVQNMP